MRAIAIEGFGEIAQLRPMALPRPQPGKGEILIRVVAVGVNAIDCTIRQGRFTDQMPHRFPLIPGWDAAGVVEEFGEGAGRFRKGDRVWAFARQPTLQWGTYAEYVSVPEDGLGMMPAKLLFEEAASVPTSALSAHQALFGGPGVEAGKTVLIHGAGGGVGHFALQFANQAGARVIATAGSAKLSFILGLGAEVAIDYAKEDFRDAMRRHCPDGADLVVDTIGGETLTRSYDVLRAGGRLVSLVDKPDEETAQKHEVRAHAMQTKADPELLQKFARLFDQKKLLTHVQKIYPLSAAADAHTAIEEGHVQGKLVLNL